ncbi:hypothetical protein QBC40DRAFT_77042 [Triangularia verruculosa]|uniref:Uncharacterized protein n=1 Tax=Triangularia verruculosa TaxID=2587418 RepID=A0AAN6XIL5_9PEZI|nr:hypothetical protein QBC40DRAFT_77042 [Triangularia verruculosa]
MDPWDHENFSPPFELRDQQEQAEAWYNNPARQENRRLAEENLRLKKLLRESGISWDKRLTLDLSDPTGSRGTWAEPGKKPRRSSRSGKSSQRLPNLPVEIILFILEYSLTSHHPIIDPLSRLNPNAITSDERKISKNQVAISFLATCKAYHAEGTRFLWKNNSFIFTDYLTLQNFSTLGLEHRKNMRQITMRITARYYDDDPERTEHPAPHPKPTAGRRDLRLRVIQRVQDDNSLARRGFRSYTWHQVVDFLDVLRPPFDPNHDQTKPRPRLLPGLESLRIDLVNFVPDYLTPPGGPQLHNLASHDLALSLRELQLTGLPECHWGADLSAGLARLVKDDGLFLKAEPTYIFSNRLRKQSDIHWEMRAIRAWKVLADEYLKSQKKKKGSSTAAAVGHHNHHSHNGPVKIPAVPEEEGAPETQWKERRTLWKRVPVSRDAVDEREWVEFDRTTGAPIPANEYGDPATDSYDPDELVCHHCQMMHSPYDDEY